MAKVVSHLEEPKVGQSYPNYYAAKLASKFVKVVFLWKRWRRAICWISMEIFQVRKKMAFDQFIDEYYVYWQRMVSNQELRKLFSPVSDSVKSVWTRDIFSDVFKTKGIPEYS